MSTTAMALTLIAPVIGLIVGTAYSQTGVDSVTIEWEETGDRDFVKRGILSRHPNGSTAESSRAFEIRSGKAYSEVRIVNDTVAGTRTTVDDASATRVTMPINAKNFETARKLAKAGCGLDLAQAPSDNLLGFRIYRLLLREQSGPEGARGMEVWVAPDLDCLEVKKVDYEIRDGQRKEILRRVATRIYPDRHREDLHAIPAHYREVQPSEQIRLTRERDLSGHPIPGESLRKLDTAYENSRSKLK